MDMENDVFAGHIFGKVALRKMRQRDQLSESFRLYEAGRVDKYGTLEVKGAEFRRAKSGPNKGLLSIMLKGTERVAFVSRNEMDSFES